MDAQEASQELMKLINGYQISQVIHERMPARISRFAFAREQPVAA